MTGPEIRVPLPLDLVSLKRDVLELVEKFVQRQWADVSSSSLEGGRSRDCRAIDPEALLLFTRRHFGSDFPLPDFGQFLNSQRLRNLGGQEDGLSLSRTEVGLDLFAPASFAFLLRAVLGIGARAEVVRVLMGTGGQSIGLRRLTEGAAVSRRQVRRVLSDLQELGLVHPDEFPHEKRFYIEVARWSDLLKLRNGAAPEFVPWPAYLPACTEVIEWLNGLPETLGGIEGYQLILSARDLVATVQAPFWPAAGRPHWELSTGEEFWVGFSDYVRLALSWLDY